jgi:hypothetical protein
MPVRTRFRGALFALPVFALTFVCSGSTGQGATIYTVDIHRIGPGSAALANGCFRLSSSVGQPAPGYSSDGSTYALLAGFWAAAPAQGVDEIYFDGFERC